MGHPEPTQYLYFASAGNTLARRWSAGKEPKSRTGSGRWGGVCAGIGRNPGARRNRAEGAWRSPAASLWSDWGESLERLQKNVPTTTVVRPHRGRK